MSAPPSFSGSGQTQVLSVSQLTEMIKIVVENNFPEVWVAGQVSNVSRPPSGHCYFTLKDEAAQLGAVLWRPTAQRLRFKLEDGLEVVCFGRINVYPPHGKYQLIVEHVEPLGLGPLELAFRQLYQKLAREGLFDVARKRPLPAQIRRVAVVTSPTGAAIRDFLRVLYHRWPLIDVVIVPVRVQGDGAAEQIAMAIQCVNSLHWDIDCLVVTRGGGSLEDLWAFNEEIVVRAICASRIPVVSAVGHEIDVTLADLAADVRALTPSNAAERISPDVREVERQLEQFAVRLRAAVRANFDGARERLRALASRPVLRQPKLLIYQTEQRLDDLQKRLLRMALLFLQNCRQQVETLAGKLEALSPLKVLSRGYTLTMDDETGRIITTAQQARPGQLLRTRFATGQIVSRVESIQ